MRKQFQRAAAHDRQVVDLLLRENAFAGARLRLDHFGLRRDRDRLGLLADIEPHVDTTRIVRADRDRLLLVGLEAGELDLQVVGAGEQAREEVLPALVADSRLHPPSTGVGHRDVRPGHDTAARVLDGAAYGCGR